MHRILMAADPAAARLVEIATDRSIEPKDAIVAIRELLDRAGVRLEREPATGSADGTVLCEEFIAIHRRRVGHDDAETESDPG